jgi:hypothetical protein
MLCFVVINHNTDSLANLALVDLEETANTTAHYRSLLIEEFIAIPHHFAAVPRGTYQEIAILFRERDARPLRHIKSQKPGSGRFPSRCLVCASLTP